MVFCRSTLVYILGGPGLRVGAKVKVYKRANIKEKIPFPLIKAFSASLFFSTKTRLQQIARTLCDQ